MLVGNREMGINERTNDGANQRRPEHCAIGNDASEQMQPTARSGVYMTSIVDLHERSFASISHTLVLLADWSKANTPFTIEVYQGAF